MPAVRILRPLSWEVTNPNAPPVTARIWDVSCPSVDLCPNLPALTGKERFLCLQPDLDAAAAAQPIAAPAGWDKSL